MRTARRFLLAIAAVLPLMTVLSIGSSQATSSSLANWTHYFQATWNLGVGDNPPPVHFARGSSFVTQNVDWNADSDAAIATWNGLNSRFQFADVGAVAPEAANHPACNSDYATTQPNELHAGPVPAGFIGVTWPCFIGGRMVGFSIVIDPGVNWFTSPSTATGGPSSTQQDLQSALTHEFGHAAGWWGGHFQDCTSGLMNPDGSCSGTVNPEPADICGATVDRGTMCAQSYSGRTEQRTLSDNDKVTFYGAYPKEPVPGGGVPSICNPFVGVSRSSLDGATTSGTPVVC